MPARTITPDDLVTCAHVDRATIDRIVRDLGPAGLTRDDTGALRLRPSADDGGAIAALVDMYDTQPLSVVRAIRARGAPTKSFADVFRNEREP